MGHGVISRSANENPEEQMHRKNLELAQEFLLRNPTLQGFKRKINLIAGETPLDEILEHAEKAIDAAIYFSKKVQTKNQVTQQEGCPSTWMGLPCSLCPGHEGNHQSFSAWEDVTE